MNKDKIWTKEEQQEVSQKIWDKILIKTKGG